MIVKPVEGRLIIIPGTKLPVPKEGLRVNEHEVFWQMCIRDGDVTVDEDHDKRPVDEPVADHHEGA